MNKVVASLASSLLLVAFAACGEDDAAEPQGSGGTGGSARGGSAGSTGKGGKSSSQGGETGEAGSDNQGEAGSGVGGGAGGSPSETGVSGAGGASAGGAGGAGDSGPNIVFVSSQTYAAQALGGLEGADDECQALADAAGLPGTFVAWLSDSETDARDRLGTARGWVRTDGKPFADTVDDITSGAHFYTPQLDENGDRITTLPAPVITGTQADGTKYAPFGGYCEDYTAPDATYGVTRGDLNFFDDRWTVLGEFVGDMVGCNVPARLYCFQIDHQLAVEAAFPPSRKAFVTKGAHTPADGIAGFDGLCGEEASAENLTGSFIAFVSSTSEAAADRLDLTGLTYARMDGVPLVEDAADIADGTPLDVPINQHADGTTISGPNQRVFTGSALPSDLATDVESCDDWTISAFDNLARTGNPAVATAAWWAYSDDWHCNTWIKVYCFEE